MANLGGAVSSQKAGDASLFIACSNFSNNGNSSTTAKGGALFIDQGGRLNVSSSSFVSNRAAGAGGGVYVEEGGVAEVVGCGFEGNECGSGFGGGMAVFRSKLVIEDSGFKGNEVRGRPGAGEGLEVQGLGRHGKWFVVDHCALPALACLQFQNRYDRNKRNLQG